MSLINLAECDEASVAQIFNVMEDGRIALDASASPRKKILQKGDAEETLTRDQRSALTSSS